MMRHAQTFRDRSAILFRWRAIRVRRQNFSCAVDALINMAQRVQDDVLFIDDDEIGSPRHAFKDELQFALITELIDCVEPVSYTHLDVYKRQALYR